jgi:hypothetical protein
MANESEFRVERKQWKEEGKWEKLHKYMKYIRKIDLRLCDKADFSIVYIDNNVQSFGTLEELFILNRQKKPVLVVLKQGKKEASDWLFGTLPPRFLFDSFDELFKYLDYVDKADLEDFDSLDRWVFLNKTEI